MINHFQLVESEVQMSKLISPFAGLLVGVVLRALLPYWIAALEQARDTGEMPRFDAKTYLVPPIASLLICVTGYAVILATVPGAFQELAGLSFVAASAIGYAGSDILRQGQKLLSLRR